MARSNGISSPAAPALETPLRPTEWERVLGLGLAPLRAARGWTQTELARRSGLNRRTILRIERQEYAGRQATLPTLEALARAFGYVHVSDLWTALQAVAVTDPGTPLIVGERLRQMVLAWMDCTPEQQTLLEGVILIWAARQRATALGAAHVLDLDVTPNGI